MHACPDCGAACKCDDDDVWHEAGSMFALDCCHECPTDDDDDAEPDPRDYDETEDDSMSIIESKVRAALVATLGVDEDAVTPDATIDHDLHADSLDRIELQMALEDEFGIEIPDTDGQSLFTVQQIVDYITERTDAAA